MIFFYNLTKILTKCNIAYTPINPTVRERVYVTVSGLEPTSTYFLELSNDWDPEYYYCFPLPDTKIPIAREVDYLLTYESGTTFKTSFVLSYPGNVSMHVKKYIVGGVYFEYE